MRVTPALLALLLGASAPAALLAQEAAPADAPEATPEAAPGDAPEAAPGAAPAEGEAAPAYAPATRDTVVATVGGTDITLGEVVVAAAQLPPQYQALPPEVLFPGLVDQLVQQELLAQTVEGEPARVALALAVERRSLLAGEAVDALSQGAVTEEAVQAAYDATYGAQEPGTEWSASHILVGSEAEAQAARARLDAGEDFAAVAAELSQDPGSAAQGGSLGFFGPGMMVPEFEAAVASLEVGQVSDPVESQFGWHVVRLDETRPLAPPALDAVRPEIEGQLRQEAVEARLMELEAGAQVTRLTDAVDPASIADLSLLAE